MELWQFHLSYSRELIVNLLLLSFQLFLIRKILPLAASADAEMLANRSGTNIAQLLEINYFSFHERTFLLDNLHIDNIARNTERNKHHLVLMMEKAFTLGSNTLYGDTFENGIWFTFSTHFLFFNF